MEKNDWNKTAKTELIAFTQHLAQTKRKLIPGIPPEDFMEQAADCLEDNWGRKFFMTVAGFSRLILRLGGNPFPMQLVLEWLAWRYPQIQQSPWHQFTTHMIEASLSNPNWNITLKRMTAILLVEERVVLIEGVCDTLFPEGRIPTEKLILLESLLTKLLLSDSMAQEVLENWQKKRLPKHL